MTVTWSPGTLVNGIVFARVGGSEKPVTTTKGPLSF